MIHTDFEKGFIRAQVYSLADLEQLRQRGRDQGRRQAAHGRQGVRRPGRRHHALPVQRLTRASQHVATCTARGSPRKRARAARSRTVAIARQLVARAEELPDLVERAAELEQRSARTRGRASRRTARASRPRDLARRSPNRSVRCGSSSSEPVKRVVAVGGRSAAEHRDERRRRARARARARRRPARCRRTA